MNSRNKILSQILVILQQYDLEILFIEFKNINSITDEVKVKFKIDYDEFLVKYLYEKDNMYEVNAFICYLKYELNERLKEYE